MLVDHEESEGFIEKNINKKFIATSPKKQSLSLGEEETKSLKQKRTLGHRHH